MTNRSFVGRDEELSKALHLITTGKSIVIRAERGMGKSSFTAELARRHSRDLEFVRIDVDGMTTLTQFLQTMTNELVGVYRTEEGVIDTAGWEILERPRLRLAVLQKEHLTTTAIDDIQTLAPPTKKELEIATRAQRNRADIRMCSDCGRPLKWIEKYHRHYCYSCRKYLPRQRKVRSDVVRQDAYLDKTCPACGSDTFFAEKYSHYYCPSCKKYPFVHLRGRRTDDFTNADVMGVLELPHKVASQLGRRVVVIFDDFQNIVFLEARGFLKAMRSEFETHSDVSYVFTGRNGPTLESIFEDEEGPFHDFATPLDLGPIAAEEMERFLMRRFLLAGGKLSRDDARRVVSLSNGYPSIAQRIAHELFHLNKEPSSDDLDHAIRLLIEQESHAREPVWESIRSPLQRRYLIACVTEPRVPHGVDFVRRYELKSRSHVQRVETQLEAKGIVQDGEVIDPLFVLWLRSLAGLN